MSKHLYRESLKKLQAELTSAETDHKQAREAIVGLRTNVMAILEQPGEVPFVHHHNLLNDLKKHLTLFETRHPTLTGAVNNVINALSNMGI